MSYISGNALKELRLHKGLTQKELAGKLYISEKTVSKWETQRGYPDIAILPSLADALGISVAELFSCQSVKNPKSNGILKKQVFYVCPLCGNVIQASSHGNYSCCGLPLPECEVEENDSDHQIKTAIIDGEYVVTLDHPMTKEHYISFVCYVTGNTSELYMQYPEQDALARFRKKGHGFIYAYCNKHGLLRIRI